jgi:prepilin-type N-terminal cleavage/methylation domain-containing protein
MSPFVTTQVTSARRRKQRGFSLIELLIVVAIIVILITMALPKLAAAKMSANETAAVAALRQISQAQTQYSTTYTTKGFAGSLEALGTGGLANGTTCTPAPEHACLIDSTLSTGAMHGYRFQVLGGTPVNGVNMTFSAGAAPLAYNSTGARLFCVTSEDTQIRADANIGASTTPPSPTVCISGQFSPM